MARSSASAGTRTPENPSSPQRRRNSARSGDSVGLRLGVIARADNRGLGIQTWEFARHLQPERVLVVDMSHNSPYESHHDRFPGALVVPFSELSDETVGPFMDGLDLVLTAETPYWWGPAYEQPGAGLYELARSMDVRTVCQVNPEFFVYALRPDLPKPDLLVAPTTWRLAEMNEVAEVRHLPFPVARDRLPFTRRTRAETFLHVVGHRAAHDRNGTLALLRSLRALRRPIRVVVHSQSQLPRLPRMGPKVEVDVRIEDRDQYWDVYDEGDVLVLPRRFGGQSLPMNEALSLGMPLVTTALDPQRSWVPPESLVPVRMSRHFRTQGGSIRIADPSPRALADTIDRFAREPELVERLSVAADEYAQSISWEAMLPRYRATFEEVMRR